jgi:hypothetical protein
MLAFLKDNIPGSCLSSKIRYGRLADRSTSPRREQANGRHRHCRGGQPTKSLGQGLQHELAHDLFSRSHQHDYDHDWNRSDPVDDRAPEQGFNRIERRKVQNCADKGG